MTRPAGIEIFLTFKHGSNELARDASMLSCPTLKLLGVFSSEVPRCVPVHLPASALLPALLLSVSVLCVP
eukprot:m.431802 g.431802  ORF g.431802 m.431802 type:complete len:70 (-) comp17350_c0_seq1:6716-6925(-)